MLDFIAGFFTGCVYGTLQYLCNTYIDTSRYVPFFLLRLIITAILLKKIIILLNPSYLLFFGGFIFSLIGIMLIQIKGIQWN